MKSQKVEISSLPTPTFIEWYKSLDNSFQEALIGMLGDDKEKQMKQIVRQKKLNKLYER